MAVAVPLIDTTLAIARRFLSGQPIFKADRSHIHHRLLAHGFAHRNAVLLLYVAAGAAGSLALCLLWVRDYWQHVILAVFAAAVILGVRQLDYPEFHVLRRLAILRRATPRRPTYSRVSKHPPDSRYGAESARAVRYTF